MFFLIKLCDLEIEEPCLLLALETDVARDIETESFIILFCSGRWEGKCRERRSSYLFVVLGCGEAIYYTRGSNMDPLLS